MAEEYIQIFEGAPLLLGFAMLITVLAWLFHLIKPALLATFSPKYKSFEWVGGNPGFLEFIKLSYKCVFHAGDLFTVAYKKVTSSHEDS